jgi:hypothetical protein
MASTIKFQAKFGSPKTVNYGDPMFCTLDGIRVRFNRQIDETSIEVMDNNGKILPDYRNPTQLIAY